MKQPLWTLPEPVKRTEKELFQWVNGQIGHGIPRQVLWNHLLDWENRKLSSEEKETSMKVASRLLDVMVDRNLNGKTLEASGEIDQAVTLYEKNVSDLFGGNHPYDRLRVIYTKRKQFAEAIRVCRTFVNITDILVQEGSERSDLNPKRAKFMSWIEKLEDQQRLA